ncbi:ERV/ALR sulfhydryl oxidase domain-containing protein [Lactarius deliciosus]|nr:ERV/ALR sulfhydryl oxidase domain-containing protein [Lactarius deliciosus]
MPRWAYSGFARKGTATPYSMSSFIRDDRSRVHMCKFVSRHLDSERRVIGHGCRRADGTGLRSWGVVFFALRRTTNSQNDEQQQQKQTVLSHPGWSSDQTENHARSAPPSETGNRPPPKKQRLPLRRPPSRTATASAASAVHDDDVARLRRAHCPPDSEALGRATWTFLHTTAAYYPERPSPTQRAHMLQLLHALPTLYPCGHCADDLGERIRSRPPEVGSRAALGAWLCATHNEVNALLGKPTFDCARVDERWKDGPKDGSCD